ncbi:Choline-sulfatase [Bythopirellula goksoeyrii]|uniref:Choline-sulfatase n=2 Tax=Bythopirellula goksoeyrii TaxID=1400387 RepID=A0A5B9QQF6_9BACT|nr:Choline-sulfatase [Bythopirellula goksoeyrii]
MKKDHGMKNWMDRKYIVALMSYLGVMICQVSVEAKPLNVLFIVIDDLRPELGCYGNDSMVTPNIDRLATKGVKFNHAYCQYPVCNPSRSSFLTGKRPDELGIVSNRVSLRKEWPNIITLPQLFRKNGYFTAGLGKLFHQGLDDNGSQTLFRGAASFDFSYKALGNSPKIGKKGEGRKAGDGSIPWCKWLAAEGGDEAQPDGMLAAEAVRVLEEHHDQPFFIGVGFHKPHDPFIAPKEYFDLYPLDKVKLAQDPEDRIPLLKHALPKSYDFSKFTDQDCREIKRAYQACTSFSDAQVGKLFEAMDRLELWDSTIVLLLGDHGYHLGEHGWWNKVTVFELGARGPMVMWVPCAEKMGQETDSVVEFLDIYPTFVDYCGLKAPHKLSGKSLRPVLENPSSTWDKAAYTQVVRGGVGMGYSVRVGPWRFTQWGNDGEGGIELYDHSKDQLEYYNLADQPEYSKLRKRLATLLKKGFPVLN